jgi:hypothetical protein
MLEIQIQIQIQNTGRRRRKGYAEGAEGIPKRVFVFVGFTLIEVHGF